MEYTICEDIGNNSVTLRHNGSRIDISRDYITKEILNRAIQKCPNLLRYYFSIGEEKKGVVREMYMTGSIDVDLVERNGKVVLYPDLHKLFGIEKVDKPGIRHIERITDIGMFENYELPKR